MLLINAETNNKLIRTYKQIQNTFIIISYHKALLLRISIAQDMCNYLLELFVQIITQNIFCEHVKLINRAAFTPCVQG